MQDPEQQTLLKRRLRGLLIVLSLLVPAFCVFGGLALAVGAQQPGIVAYVLFGHWLLAGAAIGWVLWRAQRTLGALAQTRQESLIGNPDEPKVRS